MRMPNTDDTDRPDDDQLPGWMIAMLSVAAVAACGYMAYGFLAWQVWGCR
jgi:hypothetical protein